MKASLLAGRAGARLYPLMRISSDQLQAVYDKLMIYSSATVMMAAGIRDFCLISYPSSLPSFKNLLGLGDHLGINIDYREQTKPEGIAQAFLIAADFVGTHNVTLTLGDNIFSDRNNFPWAIASFKAGAFIYNHRVVDFARSIKPSARGELEAPEANLECLRLNQLSVHCPSWGFAWLDSGISTALQEASGYIEAIEGRQGVKIRCPEEAVLVRCFIALEQFEALVQAMPNCEYRDYLNLVADEFTESN